MRKSVDLSGLFKASFGFCYHLFGEFQKSFLFTFCLAFWLFGNGVECGDMARYVFAFEDVYLPDSEGGVA